MKPIRVLIVDDSAVIRQMYSHILNADPDIEVVDTASDPYIARDKLVKYKPDVMTLDIEMPRMDGLTFLKKVMNYFPVRTLVVSSLSTQNSPTMFEAFRSGAIDVLPKPAIDVERNLTQMSELLIQKVKSVAAAKLIQKKPVSSPVVKEREFKMVTTNKVIAIASSTGGTEALRQVLPNLPANSPGILICQHLPPSFTGPFAQSLNEECEIEVREAKNGERVVPGRALIAPGDFHMVVKKSGAFLYVTLNSDPPLHSVRPAADYMMSSLAKAAGPNAIGVVLTGMGKDGARGLKDMRDAGSFNIAQNEESCVVFGMPKAAMEIDAINKTVALDDIAASIVSAVETKAAS